MSDTVTLSALVLPEQYRESRQSVFPTPYALHWDMRVHRLELIEAGALLRPTGRWLIYPPAYDGVKLRSGTERAKERVSA